MLPVCSMFPWYSSPRTAAVYEEYFPPHISYMLKKVRHHPKFLLLVSASVSKCPCSTRPPSPFFSPSSANPFFSQKPFSSKALGEKRKSSQQHWLHINQSQNVIPVSQACPSITPSKTVSGSCKHQKKSCSSILQFIGSNSWRQAKSIYTVLRLK